MSTPLNLSVFSEIRLTQSCWSKIISVLLNADNYNNDYSYNIGKHLKYFL